MSRKKEARGKKQEKESIRKEAAYHFSDFCRLLVLYIYYRDLVCSNRRPIHGDFEILIKIHLFFSSWTHIYSHEIRSIGINWIVKIISYFTEVSKGWLTYVWKILQTRWIFISLKIFVYFIFLKQISKNIIFCFFDQILKDI